MDEDGAPTAFSLTLNATDANNDTLTWSVQTQATKGSASVSGSGNSKVITYVPTANENGTDSFVVRVSDGALTDDITVNVVIAAVNDAPTLSGTPDATAVEGRSYQFIPTAADIDEDTLTFSISNQPGWMAFNSQTGELSGTPVLVNVGVNSNIVISVSDGSELVSLAAFNLNVISAAVFTQQQALEAISITANQAMEPAPTVQNYIDAGIENADEETLQRILPILNRAVAQQATADDVNELSEVQALVDTILLGQDGDGDGLPGIVEAGGDVNKDTDNDGTPDLRDGDADNDGIADVLELALDATDSDEDGIIDWFDADTDNDGELNDSETQDDNLDGVKDSLDTLAEIIAVNNAMDTDGDSLINSLDLDADNDGVFDVIEAGLSDSDENALLDNGVAVISDGDLLPDSDMNGTANFLQLISDGQQRDLLAAGIPEELDKDQDGKLDSSVDLDKDGLMDVIDNAIGAFGSYRDMDGDGIPNHLDDDDDNDGIPDVEENNNSGALTGMDADADGIDDGIDYEVNGTISGEDSNNNGVQDALELPDTDGDGIADYLDNDGDNDGVTDDHRSFCKYRNRRRNGWCINAV